MTNVFAITAATSTVTLDSKRQGEISFTVSNSSGRSLSGRAAIRAEGKVSSDWFTLEGDPERQLPVAATEQFTVRVAVPAELPAGDYLFRLNMIGIDNPDEEFAEGPTVTVTVANPIITRRKIPWWLFLIIALVLIVVGGAIAFFALRGDDGSLTISASDYLPAEVAAGNEIRYTFAISNTGRSATTAVFSNTLPTGTTFVTSSADCAVDIADGPLTCTLAEPVAGGAATPVDLVLAVDTATRGLITNTVTIGEVTLPLTATIVGEATLDVVLNTPEVVDGAYIYIAEVTNRGPSLATDILLSYDKAELVFDADGQSGGANCEDNETALQCALGNLSPGSSQTMTLTLQPASSGTLATMVTAQSNESSLASSNEITVSIAPAEELAVNVETNPARAVVGEEVTLTVTVINATSRSASNVELEYIIPDNATFISVAAGDGNRCLRSLNNQNLIECELGVIPAISNDEPGLGSVNIVLGSNEPGTIESNISLNSTEFGLINRQSSTLIEQAFSATGIRFDGQDDWAQLDNFAVPESFSVEMWINPDSAKRQIFFGKHTPEGGNLFLIGYWEDELRVNIGDESFGTSPQEVAGLQHIAVTVEKITATQSDVRFYRDGILFWQNNFSSITSGTEPEISQAWVLAQDWDGADLTDFFGGTMTEVRVWDHVRTQDEINTLMEQRLEGSEAGLLGYWPMIGNSGTTIPDLSGNGHTGVMWSGATWVETPADFGGAMNFDGVNDFIGLGNPAGLNFEGEITIAAWIFIRSTDGFRNIVAHGHDLAPNSEMIFRADQGNLLVGSWNGLVHGVIVPIEDAWLNSWIHLTTVYNGTSWQMYIDGQLVGEATDSVGAVFSNGDWALGARGTGTERFFDGMLDEVRIYNRALSAAEIAATWNVIISGTEPGLVLYYRFDEGVGNRVFDLSGNNYNGTIFEASREASTVPTDN